ncbi:hypothetical protein NUW54_g10746 [Trametes sanguinea]|uniref:Uncharacterized protein n=1 Tax=Trametes sanguinea TaxID=158606 RepID=A0ACC1NUB0_9APHY|nr:hypothetical protein NUW54_g10746 [Trametes sanguinea]
MYLALAFFCISCAEMRGHTNRTDAKIAKMEAKLRQLESAAEGSTAGSSSLPTHPSLPPKPVGAPIIPERRHTPTSVIAPTPMASRDKSRAPPLPVLPLKPSAHLPPKPTVTPPVLSSTPSPPRTAPVRKSALSGVRIVKHKPNTSGS